MTGLALLVVAFAAYLALASLVGRHLRGQP